MTTKFAPAGPSGVRVVPDLVFSRVGGIDRLADVYLPEGNGPHPVVIFLHGGGWRFGDRKLGPDLRRHFASQGIAMVSIDYRLSTEAGYPAAIEDTRTAIRWVRSQADAFGIDPARIALWGSSAGGHLAMMAALADGFDTDEHHGFSAKVCGVAQGYGVVDFLSIDAQRDPSILPEMDPESALMPKARPVADPESLEALFLGGAVVAGNEQAVEAAPASHLQGDAPPFLIMHGTVDAAIPLAQSRMLFDGLAALGADVTFIAVDGLGHGFLNRTDLDDRGDLTMTRYSLSEPVGARINGRVFGLTLAFFNRVFSG